MDNRRGGFRGNQSSRDTRSGFRGNQSSRDDSRGGFRGNQGPKEMHKAVCGDCGNDCEVPFKPKEGRPVFCKECFGKHKKF